MTVVNTVDGTSTGTQLLGTITVGVGNVGSNNSQTYADDRVTLPVATASGSVADRFDDPRYYSGDSPTG